MSSFPNWRRFFGKSKSNGRTSAYWTAGGVDRPMDLKKELKWFLGQLRPFIRAHLTSVLFTVLSSAMFLWDPLIIKWMIDVAFPKRNLRLLLLGAVAFFAVYVCRIAFSSLASLISFGTVQKLTFRMRLNLLKHINFLSADYHENVAVGEKLYRVERDVDQITDTGSDFVPYVLRTAFNTLFVVVTMFVLNFRLTSMVLPLMPLFFVLKKRFRDRLRSASDVAQKRAASESSFLQEHLGSLVQVKLLRCETRQTHSFVRLAAARVRALRGRKLTEISFSMCCTMVIVLGTIAVLSYGGYEVLAGSLTVGGFVAFYSYLGRLFDPMNAAVEIYSRLNRVSTSIRRIFDVIELSPSVPEDPNAISLASAMSGTVELRSVTFHYRSGLPVLGGLDLTIGAGEKVALIGRSGSGKSTIARLIARLYDPEDGTIRIDKTDVRRFTLESLRRNVCYLPQEAVLFDRTLKENLLLGDPEASDEEIQEALRIALLKGRIFDSRTGWDTPLGPRGGRLSGGERQRLALARAILQKPKMLILDESTSAVDVPTEKLIFQNLLQRFRNQTMLFISHRVSALEWVDRVIVLEKGTIEDEGTHEQLIARPGLYKTLHGRHDGHAPLTVAYSHVPRL